MRCTEEGSDRPISKLGGHLFQDTGIYTGVEESRHNLHMTLLRGDVQRGGSLVSRRLVHSDALRGQQSRHYLCVALL